MDDKYIVVYSLPACVARFSCSLPAYFTLRKIRVPNLISSIGIAGLYAGGKKGIITFHPGSNSKRII